MFSKKSAFLLLMVISSAAWGQEKEKKATRFNIPGTFIVDLGVNIPLNAPDTLNKGFWGSRTMNVYYQYPIRLGKSKLSFNPGIGLSMERWKFTDNQILINPVEATDQIDQYQFTRGTSLYPGIKKSMLVTNYLEMPIEFRYDTRPNDIARSFSVAIGGRVGVLTNSMMKIKYTDDGENFKLKDKKSYGLNPIRYGVYTRIGIGGFNWFAFYNLSEMFETDKGPNDSNKMSSMTVGISINGF